VHDTALEKKRVCLLAGSESAEMTDFYVAMGKVLFFSVLSVPCPSQSRASRISLPHWGMRRQIPLFLVSR